MSVSVIVILVVVLSPHLRILINWLLEQTNGALYRRKTIKTLSDVLGERAIMSILVIGINNTIKLLIQRQKEDKHYEEQKKLLLQTELSFLRNQISPHFFMNTLNNIHALITIDPEKASKSVIQLSELMRRLLNDAKTESAPIKEEFNFLTSYINLMKLRCSQRVKINIDFHIENSEQLIPSFLLVSLVENAFKYGIDYSKPSFINISASIKDEMLYFITNNSKNSSIETTQKTGVGLNNLRKQLDLLFQNNYSLDIIDEEDQFSVNLKIPLNND
jgi:LytS/YehU family sensor histidine kinase